MKYDSEFIKYILAKARKKEYWDSGELKEEFIKKYGSGFVARRDWNKINGPLKTEPLEYGDAFIPVQGKRKTTWMYNPEAVFVMRWAEIALTGMQTEINLILKVIGLSRYVHKIPHRIEMMMREIHDHLSLIINEIDKGPSE